MFRIQRIIICESEQRNVISSKFDRIVKFIVYYEHAYKKKGNDKSF